MDVWRFDGIDIDWEYPAVEDREGRKEDTANLVTFMKELKEACGDEYSISATLPSSYYYLKDFDVKGMSKYLDFFNFMSYDIHGTWDGNSEWTSSVINPHTNLTATYYVRVSFDNARSLKQKAEFANNRCLGRLFAWTLDEGGPGSTANPNKLNASETSMSGASLDGGSDGSGDIYLADTIADPKSNTATEIVPLNMIIGPSTLSSATTFSIEPLSTAIEVAWTTTKTVTVSGQPTVISTIARTIQTTTYSILPVITTVIPWWNWNITA
ncbi:unnamed protein product [Penicillium viridicatum]